MATGEGRTRIMITVNEDFLAEVDDWCQRNGETRSTFFQQAGLASLGLEQQGIPQWLLDSALRVVMSQDIQMQLKQLQGREESLGAPKWKGGPSTQPA